jgi:hypothetical protein
MGWCGGGDGLIYLSTSRLHGRKGKNLFCTIILTILLLLLISKCPCLNIDWKAALPQRAQVPKYQYAVEIPLDNIDDICRSASESRHTEPNDIRTFLVLRA